MPGSSFRERGSRIGTNAAGTALVIVTMPAEIDVTNAEQVFDQHPVRLAVPPGGPVRRVMELTGLDQALPVYAGLAGATSLPGPPSCAAPEATGPEASYTDPQTPNGHEDQNRLQHGQ